MCILYYISSCGPARPSLEHGVRSIQTELSLNVLCAGELPVACGVYSSRRSLTAWGPNWHDAMLEHVAYPKKGRCLCISV